MKDDMESNTPHGPSVFVVFLVYHKNAVVTEMQLRNVFQAYGMVDDVVVKQSKTDPVSVCMKKRIYSMRRLMDCVLFYYRLLASRKATPSSSTPLIGLG